MPTALESCGSCVPQRWITVLMCSLGLFNAFTLRVCLSIAITEMVVPAPKTQGFLDDTCPDKNETEAPLTNSTATSHEKYDWDEYTQGLILSSFYWGYFLTNILGGVIADKFGGKHTMGFSILSSAILTLLTPIGVQLGGATALIAIRAIMGIGEGATFPAVSVLLAKWIPESERAWAGSWAFSGIPIGSVVGMALSGVILYHFNSWHAVFYVFGGFATFSYLLNCFFCYSRPSDNPFISTSETRYLKERLKQDDSEQMTIPWRHMIRSKPVLALLVVSIGKVWGLLTVMSDMPKYMSGVLKLSVHDNGFISSIGPIVSLVISCTTCFAADKFIAKGLLSAVQVRKIGSTFTTLGPGIFLVLGSYAGCNETLAITLQTIAVAFFGFANCSILINPLDLAPNFAGTLLGLVFGLSMIGGFLSPYIVGVLTPHQTLSEWRLVFWIILVIFVFTNLVFLIFGSADVQEWNSPEFLKRENKKKEDPNEDIELLPVRRLTKIEEE